MASQHLAERAEHPATALPGHEQSDRREPRAVVCGSFRRSVAVLEADYQQLVRDGCEVLSPKDIRFVAERRGFVLAAHEVDQAPEGVEARHIAALQQADFVWLHAPDGYVGPSAAMELGVARAFDVPVFARNRPTDVTLESFAAVVSGPSEAVESARQLGRHTPSAPLGALQHYYRRVAAERGYSTESARDTLLLLTEEIGELARAVRQAEGLARHGNRGVTRTAEELADTQLYLLHLANILDVDLSAAVVAKESVNARRYTEQAAA